MFTHISLSQWTYGRAENFIHLPEGNSPFTMRYVNISQLLKMCIVEQTVTNILTVVSHQTCKFCCFCFTIL